MYSEIGVMEVDILKLLRKLAFNTVLVLSLLGISGCSSPEDKANKFYENGMQLLEKGELTKANVEFRNALQFDRKMTKAIWGQVLVSEKQGKPRQQYKLLTALLIDEPEHLQALIKFGRLLLLSGQLDKALEKSDLSMKINNKDLSVLSLRAAVMLKLDDAPAAAKLAKQVLIKDPFYVDALMILATERLSMGDAQKAIEYLDQGLKSNNKNIPLQLIKIKILESLENPELAEDVLKRLVDYHPKVTAFNHMLAQFYLKYSRKDDAEKIYRTIVENDPKNTKAKIKLVQFLNTVKGADVGLKQLQKFYHENPDNDELKFSLVQLYLFRKEITHANELLVKIISEKPGSEAALKAKGIMAASLMVKGDKKSAEKIINEILAEDKQNENGLILKASIDIDQQKYDEAIGALRLVLRDTPTSSRALFYLAKAHNLSGSPELADEKYFKAFKASRFNVTYGLSYAQFLLKRKQSKRAEKVLQDVLSFSPGNLSALKLLAKIKLSVGDWVGAQQVVDVIKRRGDKNNLANQLTSAILAGKKDYSESIALLKEAYQSTPGNIQPVVALVRTYLLAGKTEEAGKFLDAVISASPKNSSARILRGQVYSSQGKIKQAINTYKDAIKINSTNVVSYYHLAKIYLGSKKYDKASKVLNEGLNVAPDSFSLRITQAGLYEITGKTDKAIKTYERLLVERPDTDIVVNNLASLLTENRTDKASLDKAYALSQRIKQSDIPHFKDTFGWASYHVGKYADASLLLKSAIAQLPGIPDFHYHLGMNYLAKNNKAMAREELEKALSLAGDKPFSKENEIRVALEKL